nr:Hsp20/alpha crystallin family protein [Opitutaceae bacterium]
AMHIIRYTYPTARSLAPTTAFQGRSPWAGLESEIDRLFANALGEFSEPAAGNTFPVDLYEDKTNTYVRAELPGVNRDAIHVEMVEDNLSIQASRTQKTGDREEAFAFSRTLSVPENVQADKVSASYENGVLTVTLPKREEAKPKKVSIAVN